MTRAQRTNTGSGCLMLFATFGALALSASIVIGIGMLWVKQGDVWRAIAPTSEGSDIASPPRSPLPNRSTVGQTAGSPSRDPKPVIVTLPTLSTTLTRVEQQQLAILENAGLRSFLQRTHAWPESRGATVREHWTWEDDRNALLYEGKCDAAYIDPNISPKVQRVEVLLDTELFERLEQHFGYRDEWLQRSWFTHEYQLVEASKAIEARLAEALRQRGIKLDGEMIGPDRDEIVRQSVPLLRPLAQAIVKAWRPIWNGPVHDQRYEALTSFVQRAIPYASVKPRGDGIERCELHLPSTTVLHGGDCDSKSILLATLLRAIEPRLPIVLIDIKDAEGDYHTLLGVALPQRTCAETHKWNGLSYTLIESTNGFGIGRLPDSDRTDRVTSIDVVPVVE